MNRPREEHFVGCLVGLAVGDALDLLVGGAPPALRKQYADSYLRRGRSFQDPGPGLTKGQYAAATQFARELLSLVTESGRLEWPQLAGRIAELTRRGELVSEELGTRTAAALLAEGIAWEMAGSGTVAPESSPAARAVVLGLLFGDDDDLLVKAARVQAFMTHQNPRRGHAAAVAAGLAARALHAHEVDGRAWLVQTLAAAETSAEDGRREAESSLEWLGVMGREFLDVHPRWSASRRRQADAPQLAPILWGLHAFLLHPDDLWEAVLAALAMGEGAGAVAGALAGARHGITGVPEAVVVQLNDHGRWRTADLEALARSCFLLRSAAATSASSSV